MNGGRTWKIPESVLVVIHTPAREVLLIERADAAGFWQSVTGSRATPDEPLAVTAAREVFEETGFDCREGSALASRLRDWNLCNVYEIYPRWRPRYAPGVSHNTEHVFSLCMPAALAPRLDPREHVAWRWLAYPDAAYACFSPSNAEAILLLQNFSND